MIKQIWKFLQIRKKFWLLPILVIMAGLGVLLILGETAAVAPFIYSLF